MELSKARAGDLIEASYVVARRSWVTCLAYAGVVGGAGFAIDVHDLNERGGIVLLSGLSWAAGYLLLVFMMNDAALFAHGRQRGVWSYIGLNLLSGVAILLGLVVLIVPGVILSLRWLPSYAILLGENASIVGSLKRSWRVTRQSTRVLLLASGPAFAALLVSTAAYVAEEWLEGAEIWAAYAIANGFLALATIAWTALGVAVYLFVAAGVPSEAEVSSALPSGHL